MTFPFRAAAVTLGLLVSAAASLSPSAPAVPGSPPTSTTRPKAFSPTELDVLEAIFRYQFDNNASGSQRKASTFYLALEDSRDPPPNLIQRFAANSPAVLAVSKRPRRDTRPTSRAATLRVDLGLIFRVDTLDLIDTTHATATGGYYEGGLSASGNRYELAKKAGRWTVTLDQMDWIS